MLTGDPIYSKPYKPKIAIERVIEGTDHYVYDPWSGSGAVTTGPSACFPVHCSVNLAENNFGVFVIQIEDENMDLDTYNIGQGAHVLIDCGKQSTQMTSMISGLVRDCGHVRGADDHVLYSIVGSSTGIRLNERIIYFVNEASKLASDNITLDLADTTRYARALLKSGLAAETSLGIIDATNMDTESEVRAWIGSTAIEYGEVADLASLIEEAASADVSIDVTDIVRLRYEIRQPTGGRGYTIKNKMSKTIDDADDTMYLRGKNWSYGESIYKSASFSNLLYSLLPSEPPPNDKEDLGFEPIAFGLIKGDPFNVGPNQEFAQKFKPTHSHWVPGDLYIIASQFATAAGGAGGTNWMQWFRICKDSGGAPQNAGGIVANIAFPPKIWPNTVAQGTAGNEEFYELTNEELFYDNSGPVQVDAFDLDTTKEYWLIAANLGIIKDRALAWALDIRPASATGGMQHSTLANMSTVSAGGAGWTSAAGKPCFAMPRTRSHSMAMWDPLAMKHTSSNILTNAVPISTTLPAVPSFVKTKEQWIKYIAYQLTYMARPRLNARTLRCSAPNLPPVPGDPIVLSDSVLGWSGPGNDTLIGKCGEITYQWNEFGGKGKRKTETILEIQPVVTVPRYR